MIRAAFSAPFILLFASSRDNDDVRLEAVCAIMSFISLLGPANGVRLHGLLELGGVLPLASGDIGVIETGVVT